MNIGKGITGFQGYVVLWIGQVLSLLGSSMTQFALTIWAYQETSSATALSLVAFFSFLPSLLLSPIAGALVDRYSRKTMLLVSDTAAVLASSILFILLSSNLLEIWHLYILGAFVGAFNALQFPAFSAVMSSMVRKEDYARANGLFGMAEPAATILAPVSAAMVIAFWDLRVVLLADIASFACAFLALALVAIPKPKTSFEGRQMQGNLWKESIYGFNFIWQRKPLFHMQLVFFATNLIATLATVLIPIMILAKSNNNEVLLGSIQSASSIGALVGGIVLSVWGGSKKRIHGLLIGLSLSSFFGIMPMGYARSPALWICAGFIMMFFIPILNGSSQAIWQSKTPQDVQGKVFAARRMIAQITSPLAMLCAGPLADRVFEPFFLSAGPIASSLAFLVGTGPGSGMAFLIVICGVLGTLVGISGYLFPTIRRVEDILPDYD